MVLYRSLSGGKGVLLKWVFEAELRLVPKERVSVRSLGIKAMIWVMVEGGDNSQVKSMTEELGENHSPLWFGSLKIWV
jgi:hypothetical protein